MTDSPDRWPHGYPSGGEAAAGRVVTGQVVGPVQPTLLDRPVPPPRFPPRTPPRGDGSPAPGRRSRRRRRIRRALVLLVCVLLLIPVGAGVWADTRLDRAVDLGALADRPPQGRGTNYLIVGSDSRAGLSAQTIKQLHTGGSAGAGARTDSMILVHTGAHGTTMVSLPRDSWVTIPPYVRPDTGEHFAAVKNKLNASYAEGGPELLIRTVEQNTGVRVDHYMEIGFGGFVGVVDAVGGVRMCVDRHIVDKNTGENLTKGCHLLDGREALGFVRQRHQEAKGDLGRTLNQQKFLSALAQQAATPGVLLDPGKVYGAASAGLDTLVVDKDMQLWNLARLFQAMRGGTGTTGGGKRLNVPVTGVGLRTPEGSAVQWDLPQANRLFAELRNDQPVTAPGSSG